MLSYFPPILLPFPHKHNQKHPEMHQRLYLCDEIACTKWFPKPKLLKIFLYNCCLNISLSFLITGVYSPCLFMYLVLISSDVYLLIAFSSFHWLKFNFWFKHFFVREVLFILLICILSFWCWACHLFSSIFQYHDKSGRQLKRNKIFMWHFCSFIEHVYASNSIFGGMIGWGCLIMIKLHHTHE